MKQEYLEGSLIKKAHQLVAGKAGHGALVVDATVGNGHDTLFLAGCVGQGGTVIGFDVQQEAIEATRIRLQDVKTEVVLHQQSHDLMSDYVPSRGVMVVMFNLGYLPGADKTRITKTETTLQALEQAMDCLVEGGLLSVMCYPGHAGGDREAEAVGVWMGELASAGKADASLYQREGAGSTSPFLWVAEREDVSRDKKSPASIEETGDVDEAVSVKPIRKACLREA